VALGKHCRIIEVVKIERLRNLQYVIGTFKKTAIGIGELERYTLRLRPELRRLLILVDGKRDVETLRRFFRANEFSELIDELLSHGAIESTNAPTSYLPESKRGASAATPLSVPQFRAALETARQTAKAMLGRRADEFGAKFDACKDSQALRIVVSEVQLRLIADVDEDAATSYVVAIRNAVSAVKA
jgi:hypothetical protein